MYNIQIIEWVLDELDCLVPTLVESKMEATLDNAKAYADDKRSEGYEASVIYELRVVY